MALYSQSGFDAMAAFPEPILIGSGTVLLGVTSSGNIVCTGMNGALSSVSMNCSKKTGCYIEHPTPNGRQLNDPVFNSTVYEIIRTKMVKMNLDFSETCQILISAIKFAHKHGLEMLREIDLKCL